MPANKRLMSQEATGGLPAMRPRPGQGRSLVVSSGPNNPAILQPRGAPLYASQNQGLAAGMNVQGRGARPTNPLLQRPPLTAQSSEGASLGQQPPVSVNINFNTTNINVK